MEKLLCSGNSKVRIKAIQILKGLLDLFLQCRDFRINPLSGKNAGTFIEESSATFVLPEFDFVKEENAEECFTTISAVFCRFAFVLIKMSLELFSDAKV